MSAEHYTAPPGGWTCFHCGETFTTYGLARDHFGFEPSLDPGCRIKAGPERGLLYELRRAEGDAMNAWAALHIESTDAIQAMRRMQDRHARQLTIAEEAGYARGLADARAAHQRQE